MTRFVALVSQTSLIRREETPRYKGVTTYYEPVNATATITMNANKILPLLNP